MGLDLSSQGVQACHVAPNLQTALLLPEALRGQWQGVLVCSGLSGGPVAVAVAEAWGGRELFAWNG